MINCTFTIIDVSLKFERCPFRHAYAPHGYGDAYASPKLPYRFSHQTSMFNLCSAQFIILLNQLKNVI
mgnify:FL=1